MRADKYLVEQGYFDTRAKAQAAIAAGKVIVNGEALRKASQTVPAGAEVQAEAAHPYVSRAPRTPTSSPIQAARPTRRR